ncbi:MAG: hypothetical protein MK078_03695 [Crocinitomicaceae bacterium]|nr:hypothetical protein [Crocinitomicaceae bacterium]
MKKLRIPVILVTLYLCLYAAIPELGLPMNLFFVMFGLSPLLVIGLVYRVRKKGVASERTWEEG